jgi:two-component system, NarL family, invasion response regulator UvrY
MIKIALVDDHRLMRKGLAALVNDDRYRVTLQSDNGEQFIEQVKSGNIPDVILLDINMPVMGGFETMYWIMKNLPGLPVIALSMYDQEMAVIRMITMGAKGYLMKDCEPEEVRRAIDAVVNKGYYHSEVVSAKIIHHAQRMNSDSPDDVIAPLTKREIEFLKWICSDLTYKEIADKMFVSPRTVDGYRDDLFDKLNVRSRVSLALYAFKNGIVKA